MNKNETLSLWLSVAAALFAAFLIYSYTQEKTIAISKDFGVKTSVVVASQLIREMETVRDDMVELVQVPEKFVQPGYARRIEDVVGDVALVPIDKGEQVLTNKIQEPGPETGLSPQVTSGNRAVTIPVNEHRALARLLQPGDRVDIIVALDLNTGTGQKRYIKTLFQNVEILATGARIKNELPRLHEEVGGEDFIRVLRTENRFNNITIEVKPEEAQKIIYLLSTDPENLFFTLRSRLDNSFISTLKPTELSDVLGGGINTRSPASQNRSP